MQFHIKNYGQISRHKFFLTCCWFFSLSSKIMYEKTGFFSFVIVAFTILAPFFAKIVYLIYIFVESLIIENFDLFC